MSNGDVFLGEVIGTAILILFGAGVVAAVLLNYSKAKDSGWVVIAFGWGFGVLAGAYTAAPLSGGHLNPAVTIGIAVDTGKWDKVPLYIAGQMVGAMLGAFLCWLVYFAQFQANADEEITRRQPGPRSGPAHHARPASHPQQEHLGLGLRVDPGGGTADRRGTVRTHLQRSLLKEPTKETS